MTNRVLIVGGGITGLSTAYYLQKNAQALGLSPEITVVERDEHLGGQMRTEIVDGIIMENAPDSFLVRKPWLVDLCRELGLPLVGTNPDIKKTFIWHKGQLEPIPPGMQLFIPTKIGPFLDSHLISPTGKLRALLEPLVPVRRDASDESIGSFVARRFGAEVLDKIGAPLMAGVYGGDPYELSLQATFPQFLKLERDHGSLLRTVRTAAPAKGTTGSVFQTVATGLQSVIEALVAATRGVQYRTGTALKGLAPAEDGKGYTARLSDGSTLHTDAVVLTLPAYSSAAFVSALLPAVAAELRAIEYASVVIAALAYNRADIDHPLDATGFLVPQTEHLPITASTWVTSKWSHMAPPDKVLLRGFLGRAGDKDWTTESDEVIIAAVQDSFHRVIGLTANPIHTRVFRWPNARPRYKVGHLERVARIEQQTQAAPGLYLSGAAYRGLGLPDCVREGMETAAKITRQLGWA